MTLLTLFQSPSTAGASHPFLSSGMFLGQWSVGDYLTFAVQAYDDTGGVADADSVPSYAIYEDETAAEIATGNMAKLSSVTGFYTARLQLSDTNGFEVGKCYHIRVSAEIGGIAVAAVHMFAMNVPAVNVTYLAGQSEPVDNLVLSLGNGGLVEKLNSMLEAAGADYRFTAPALAEAPTGAGTGLYSDTITVRVGGLPVDGALVQVATDSAFANILRSGYTNSLGQVTFQYDSVGTYYGRAELAGYNIATFTITVSA